MDLTIDGGGQVSTSSLYSTCFVRVSQFFSISKNSMGFRKSKRQHLKSCQRSYCTHDRNHDKFSESEDSTTFCCEIQPAGKRSNKNRTLPSATHGGPTKSLQWKHEEAPGKNCVYSNPTGTFHPFHCKHHFYLVGFHAYLLKYNGCQLALQ